MADRNQGPRCVLVLGGARSGKSTFAERLALQLAAARAASTAVPPAPPSPDAPQGTASPGLAASAAADPGQRAASGVQHAVVDAAGATSPPSGAGRVTYLATAQGLDDEMRQRIERHRAQRGAAFVTVECPLDVPNAVREHAATTDVFLLDCVTFWVTNVLFAAGAGGAQVPEGLGDFSKDFIAPEVEAAASERVSLALDDLLAALAETGATLIAVSNEVGLGLVPEYPLSRLYRDELGRANARLALVADQVFFLVAGLPLEIKAMAADPFTAPSPPAAASPFPPFPPSASEEPTP